MSGKKRLIGLIACLLELGLLTTASFRPEQVWLAKAIQGEEGGLVSPEAARAVGFAVRNRVEAAGYSDDYETVIRRGFSGALHVWWPWPSFLRLAAEVLDAPRSEHACKCVLSLQDLRWLGIDQDKAVMLFKNGVWGLAFFKDWLSWKK